MQQVRADYFVRHWRIYSAGGKSRLPGSVKPTDIGTQVGSYPSDVRKRDNIFLRSISRIFLVFIVEKFQESLYAPGHCLVIPFILDAHDFGNMLLHHFFGDTT